LDKSIQELNDQDPKIRKNAAETLGSIKNARAIEALVAALKDKSLFVRRSAADALVIIVTLRLNP